MDNTEKAMLADDLAAYINNKHTQEQCVGFIDGYYAALAKLKSLTTPDERGEGFNCSCGRNHESKEIRNNKCDLCGKDLITPH